MISRQLYLAIIMAAILVVPCSFAQMIDTSQTPTQSAYKSGFDILPPGTQTPTQQMYQSGLNHGSAVGTPTQEIFRSDLKYSSPAEPIPAYNVAISNVVQDGDLLQVLVSNSETVPVSLAGWALVVNNGTSKYSFPGFILEPTAVVTVHAGQGADSLTDLYGSNFTWAGTRDVELVDNNGLLVSEYILS